MLHWWFEQNKDNIARYKEITGTDTQDYNVSYNRFAAEAEESTKSSIAAVFSKHFPNQGGDMLSALKWYLYEQPLYYPEAPALFKDVFKREDGLIEQKSVHSKTEFEKVIKTALKSQKAVGLALRKDRDSYWHGITLWGAAFDSEDNIIAVYVADSNDKRNLINTFGIHYKNGGNRGNPYILRYDLNHYDQVLYIDTVFTLDKGEEGFQRFFETQR